MTQQTRQPGRRQFCGHNKHSKGRANAVCAHLRKTIDYDNRVLRGEINTTEEGRRKGADLIHVLDVFCGGDGGPKLFVVDVPRVELIVKSIRLNP